jgi:hypothetical protein
MLDGYTTAAASRPTLILLRMRNLSLSSAPRAAVAWCALVVFALLAAAHSAPAAEYRSIKDFRAVAESVNRYIEKYGADHVVLVVDIDNTVLAMNRPLGSDQWFEWQDYLQTNEPESPYLVAKEFPDLLEVQGVLYNLGRMHPPQPDLPEIIKGVQKRGIDTVVLTSRGDEYRAATERELKRNDYDFGRTALPTRDVQADCYLPYDIKDVKASGLTVVEAAAFELKEAKPVSYGSGIMMTSGQHKGAMLLTLFGRSDRDVKAVVYVDDHERHVARVFAALSGRDIDATTFHYQKEDPNVKRFQYGPKDDVTRRWHQLIDTLEAVFD